MTLLIARELERTLKNTYGYKPVMIRSDDRYVGLDDRYQNARKLGADLFVSIHADGFRLSSVKGASVYVWSEEASSITAATLSKNKLTTSPEVKSKTGKLDVRDFDEDAARTLHHIAYEAKIDNSIILAEKILSITSIEVFFPSKFNFSNFIIFSFSQVFFLLLQFFYVFLQLSFFLYSLLNF